MLISLFFGFSKIQNFINALQIRVSHGFYLLVSLSSRRLSAMPFDSLTELAKDIRRTVIEIIHRAQASHLGSSLSSIEILTGVYSVIDIQKIRSKSPSRDKVILSKGHAAAALYSTLYHFGLMTQDQVLSYHQRGSLLQGHVSHGVEYVEHSTGALGHGLSVGVGHAIAQRTLGYKSFTYVVCGDGEIQEGSVWEALMYASTLKLSNLVLLIDNNEISSITKTKNVINFGELSHAFSGFGLDVNGIRGHDVEEIVTLLERLRENPGEKPHVIICNTIKGKGVSFAESEAIWHYRTLDDSAVKVALENYEK